MEPAVLFSIIGTVVGLLMAGNLFFIKKLIDKIEISSVAASAATSQVQALQTLLEEMKNKMAELRDEIKELRRIEIDVAVLKSHIGMAKREENPTVR